MLRLRFIYSFDSFGHHTLPESVCLSSFILYSICLCILSIVYYLFNCVCVCLFVVCGSYFNNSCVCDVECSDVRLSFGLVSGFFFLNYFLLFGEWMKPRARTQTHNSICIKKRIYSYKKKHETPSYFVSSPRPDLISLYASYPQNFLSPSI